MEAIERAKIFAALADPLRLRILDLMAGGEEICGKELSARLDASVALVSHHAKILEETGLIVRRRDGQFSRFSLDRSRLEAAGIAGAVPAGRPGTASGSGGRVGEVGVQEALAEQADAEEPQGRGQDDR